MCLTKLLTSNNEMKTLQSNHVPPRTNNLVWLRGNAASSHPCKSSGSSYEEFPIPDGLVRSSRPTESKQAMKQSPDEATIENHFKNSPLLPSVQLTLVSLPYLSRYSGSILVPITVPYRRDLLDHATSGNYESISQTG